MTLGLEHVLTDFVGLLLACVRQRQRRHLQWVSFMLLELQPTHTSEKSEKGRRVCFTRLLGIFFFTNLIDDRCFACDPWLYSAGKFDGFSSVQILC